MFVKSWIPEGMEFIPEWLVGLTKNSLYRKGYGPDRIFSSLFDSNTIKRTEIITGTYDVENCRTQCFSNMSYSESHIDTNLYNLDKHIYDSLPIIFLDGNIKEIGNTLFASASVPLITETHKVLGKDYYDGGVTYDSPIGSFKFEIIRIIKGENYKYNNGIKSYILNEDNIKECNINTNNSKALRMTYFSCYQIDTHHNTCGTNVKDQLSEIFRQQRHTLAIHDKNIALDILYHIVGDQNKIRNENIFNMNVIELSKKLEFLETKMHYLIILYPHGNTYIKESHFIGEDILKYIDITRNNFGIDIYYSEDLI